MSGSCHISKFRQKGSKSGTSNKIAAQPLITIDFQLSHLSSLPSTQEQRGIFSYKTKAKYGKTHKPLFLP